MAQHMTDADWLSVQDDLRKFISEFRDENVVRKETDEYILLADENGHELNEIADANGVDRGELSREMHAEARRVYEGDGAGDPWSVADPVIIYKGV